MDADPYAILERKIRAGEYRPGERLTPERRLAAEFQVNRRTVRRAIERLAEVGLVRCEPGRRPVVQPLPKPAAESRTVAFLMGNEPRYHAFQVVLRGCDNVFRPAGYRILFFDTWAETSSLSNVLEREALESLIDHPVAGAIVWCNNPDGVSPQLRALQEHGIPVIVIDREVRSLEADFVGIDNEGAAQEAVEYLISLGHRRIAFVLGRESVSSVISREAGYRNALARHGLPVDPALIYRVLPDVPGGAARLRARELAADQDRPTAIFTVSDHLAVKLTKCLRDEGLRVPDDISVIGFDDIESFSFEETGLTTVHQSFELMGRQAARLLLRRLTTPDAPLQHVFLSTCLVHRSSTRQVSAALTSHPTASPNGESQPAVPNGESQPAAVPALPVA